MDNHTQSSSLGQFPSKPSRRAVDAARLRRAASERVAPGAGGLFSEAAWRQKSAIARAGMPSLDRGTYLAAEGNLGLSGTVTFVPGGLKVDYPKVPGARVRLGGGLRGRIRGKSEASRRRNMWELAQLRPVGPVFYEVLTYSDEAMAEFVEPVSCSDGCLRFVVDYEGMAAKVKRDIQVYGKRVIRAFPDASAEWTLEWEDRRSGLFPGALLAHVNVIWFGLDVRRLVVGPDENLLPGEAKKKSVAALLVQAWHKEIWYEVVGSGDDKHRWRGVDVQELDSRKKILVYVSKYVAKVQRGYDAEGEPMYTGRTWGYFNRAKLPLHVGLTFPIAEAEVVQLKRLAKRWLKGRGKSAERYGRWLVTLPQGYGMRVLGLGLDGLGGAGNAIGAGDDDLALERIYGLLQMFYDCAVASRPARARRAPPRRQGI